MVETPSTGLRVNFFEYGINWIHQFDFVRCPAWMRRYLVVEGRMLGFQGLGVQLGPLHPYSRLLELGVEIGGSGSDGQLESCV